MKAKELAKAFKESGYTDDRLTEILNHIATKWDKQSTWSDIVGESLGDGPEVWSPKKN